MLWLAWRQHRLQIAIGGLILVLIAAALAFSKGTVDEYARMVATCSTPLACAEAYEGFARFISVSPLLQFVLPALPTLIGIFAGAPLVARELEQGTHLLVWTQGISRLRWLAIKLAVLGGSTILGMGLLAALMAWWSEPVNAAIGPWTIFDVGGVVPLAYALLALVLGIVGGAIVRGTIGAMALTLVASMASHFVVASGLRPRYQSPLSAIEATQLGAGERARDWVLNTGPVNSLGHLLREYMQIVGACDNVSRAGYAACLRDHGVFLRTIYQPAGRFWTFQGIETAIYLGLAAGLLVLTMWWVRERVST